MSPTVFLSCLLASALNAGSSIFQRQAAGQPEVHELFSRHFTANVSRHPLFILGIVLQLLSAILQGVALNSGPLIVVAPMLTTDLVFLLLFLRLKGVTIGGVSVWLAAVGISLGLAGFLVIARPGAGHSNFYGPAWLILAGCVTVVVIGGVCITRSRVASIRRRTAAAAIATASTYALNAGLIKLITKQLHTGGILPLLTSWPLYALIFSGLLSLFLMQNAYAAGPLAVSQPIIEVSEPVISILIGITIFGEVVHHNSYALLGELGCAVVLAMGITRLSSSHELAESFHKEQADISVPGPYNRDKRRSLE